MGTEGLNLLGAGDLPSTGYGRTEGAQPTLDSVLSSHKWSERDREEETGKFLPFITKRKNCMVFL